MSLLDDTDDDQMDVLAERFDALAGQLHGEGFSISTIAATLIELGVLHAVSSGASLEEIRDFVDTAHTTSERALAYVASKESDGTVN